MMRHTLSFEWQNKGVTGTIRVYLDAPAGHPDTEVARVREDPYFASLALFDAGRKKDPLCPDEIYMVEVDITEAINTRGIGNKFQISWEFRDLGGARHIPEQVGFVAGPYYSRRPLKDKPLSQSAQ